MIAKIAPSASIVYQFLVFLYPKFTFISLWYESYPDFPELFSFGIVAREKPVALELRRRVIAIQIEFPLSSNLPPHVAQTIIFTWDAPYVQRTGNSLFL